MKQLTAFLGTLIVIVAVGIGVLYAKSSNKEEIKSQLKDEVTSTVSTVVDQVGDTVETGVNSAIEDITDMASSKKTDSSDSSKTPEVAGSSKDTGSNKDAGSTVTQSTTSSDTSTKTESTETSGTSTKAESTETSDSATAASSEIIIKRESNADPITRAIVEKAMEAYIKTSKDKDVTDVYGSMSKEDRDIVIDMIAENVSLSSISEMQEIMSSGDEDALTKYAEKNLSKEDQEIFAQIMKKYGN